MKLKVREQEAEGGGGKGRCTEGGKYECTVGIVVESGILIANSSTRRYKSEKD